MYPNAPLALVVVEVRFPSAPDARSLPMAAQRSLRDRLGDEWVIESLKTQRVQVEFDQAGSSKQHIDTEVVPRFTVRDRTLAVAVPQGSITIETTSYRRYPDFRAVLEGAFSAAGTCQAE
jgi:uncharacterized protein (TIGR04255 family)